MSKNDKKASEKELDELKNASVYDFLYCDTRRINSFLAQFDDAGVLEKIINRDSISKGGKRGWKINVGGNALVSGTGGSVTGGYEVSPSAQGSESSERVYDPLWANALAFLDYLHEDNMIERDLAVARIGQFVLVRGRLSVMDLSLFKGMWGVPVIRKAITSGQNLNLPEPTQTRQQRRQSERNGIPSKQKEEADQALDAGMALIGLLPHAIQARLVAGGNGAVIWTSLKEDSLVISAADLTLKHGTSIAGEWVMVGILDAFPDADADGNLTAEGIASVHQTTVLSDSPFGDLMLSLTPVLRPMLGRPFAAYGMTPLMIFREIDG